MHLSTILKDKAKRMKIYKVIWHFCYEANTKNMEKIQEKNTKCYI
jgi:hypothetical protein